MKTIFLSGIVTYVGDGYICVETFDPENQNRDEFGECITMKIELDSTLYKNGDSFHNTLSS